MIRTPCSVALCQIEYLISLLNLKSGNLSVPSRKAFVILMTGQCFQGKELVQKHGKRQAKSGRPIIPYPPHGRLSEIPRGWGGLICQNFRSKV